MERTNKRGATLIYFPLPCVFTTAAPRRVLRTESSVDGLPCRGAHSSVPALRVLRTGSNTQTDFIHKVRTAQQEQRHRNRTQQVRVRCLGSMLLARTAWQTSKSDCQRGQCSADITHTPWCTELECQTSCVLDKTNSSSLLVRRTHHNLNLRRHCTWAKFAKLDYLLYFW